MITVNIHRPEFKIADLDATPGKTILLTLTDKEGGNVTAFTDDASLRKLALEMARYAASRDEPVEPVEPPKTYAQKLFAPEPIKVDDGDIIPF